MNAGALPPALARVTIPDTFTVTAICATESCRLRLVATSDPTNAPLISGPKASAGSFHHAVIHYWASSDHTDPEACFEEELITWDMALRTDPRTAHQSPLRSLMTGIEWLGFRRKTLAAMSRARSSVKSGTIASRQKSSDREKLRISRRLRLRGRPDLVRYPSGRTIEIRDFKTGVIWDEGGRLKPSIVRQLSLYALLVMDEEHDAEVQLIVDDGEPTVVPFSRADAARSEAFLVDLLSGMDPGRQMTARELATPGGECRTCPVRHRCTAYHTTAPNWWRALPSSQSGIPPDIWGNVEHLEQIGPISKIRLIDAAERVVQVDMLSSRHEFVATDIGRPVWMFGLVARGGGRSPDGLRYHPYNFYEMPRDGRDRRAWALEVFRGD